MDNIYEAYTKAIDLIFNEMLMDEEPLMYKENGKLYVSYEFLREYQVPTYGGTLSKDISGKEFKSGDTAYIQEKSKTSKNVSYQLIEEVKIKKCELVKQIDKNYFPGTKYIDVWVIEFESESGKTYEGSNQNWHIPSLIMKKDLEKAVKTFERDNKNRAYLKDYDKTSAAKVSKKFYKPFSREFEYKGKPWTVSVDVSKQDYFVKLTVQWTPVGGGNIKHGNRLEYLYFIMDDGVRVHRNPWTSKKIEDFLNLENGVTEISFKDMMREIQNAFKKAESSNDGYFTP